MQQGYRCVFCELYRARTGIVTEFGAFWTAFDRYPVTPGHMLVIPKRHVQFLHDLNQEERDYLVNALQHAAQELRKHNVRAIYEEYLANPVGPSSAWFAQKALDHPNLHKKPDGFNFGMNEGVAAGQTVDHLHWHVIPRYRGDMQEPQGGVRHVIPTMGNYRRLPPPSAPPQGEHELGMEEDLRASRDILRLPQE